MPGSIPMVRAKETWELRAYLGRDESGWVRHRHATVPGSKREAERALARLVAEGDATCTSRSVSAPRAWGEQTTVNDVIAGWQANGWETCPRARPRRGSKLERDYLYARPWRLSSRGAATVEWLDLGTEVELTRLRTEATFNDSLAITSGTGEVKTVFGDGVLHQRLPDMEALSQMVETLNERFELDLAGADQLFFDQYEAEWLADPEVRERGRNNIIENFKLVLDRNFLNTVISRMDENDALFRRILDDPRFQEAVRAYVLQREGVPASSLS